MSLFKMHNKVGEAAKLLKPELNHLASHVKVNVLMASRKILANYKDVKRAIDRLLDLSTDVEDIRVALPKYSNDPSKQETYRAEYTHYLNLLRTNFDYL